MNADVLSVVIAAAALIVALFALRASYRAPLNAAKYAEDLRRENAAADQINETKRQVLKTLMQYRGQMLHQDLTSALNLIDIIFVDDRDVREAYQQFWNSVQVDSPMQLRRERLHKIIETIVRNLGMSENIRSADIQRAYFPEWIGRAIDVQIAETNVRWSELCAPRAGAATDGKK